MKGDEYRDRIGRYLHEHFSNLGLVVYSEVSLGKTVIGKNRRLDLFLLRPSDQCALGLECKYQEGPGTTDEKIPYSLQDLKSMWIPGVLVYGGEGWSAGVLHTLEATREAVFCEPDELLQRNKGTVELDHVVAAVFGLWDRVISSHRRLVPDEQLLLPAAPFAQAESPRRRPRLKKPGT